MTDIVFTNDGRERLIDELEQLRRQRTVVVQRLQEAVEDGGAVATNGGYADAGNELELLDRRIATLERRLRAGRLADARLDGELDVGETVRVRDKASGEIVQYRIVGTGEGDPDAGDISHDSPVGAALIGRRVADVIDVQIPNGLRRMEIVEIQG